ncbi:uncharacterized protein LOC143854902 [Tasmannia lanceolata]|uniref:uncharacterized protein LOC143854902 n=1 Tax=Tasmannia lanceolata TaxID=3420 RepID=UPI0040641673
MPNSSFCQESCFQQFDSKRKRCFYLDVPGNSSPLGLTLRKTPSFLSLLETKLSNVSESRKEESNDAVTQQITGKTKASNFSASLLRIGSWERVSSYEGELVAKFYYAKRKLVWEVLDTWLKNKIEFQWLDITSLKATYNDNGAETLEIELSGQPLFFEETNPQPRKHTLWKSTVDFTGGQASSYRRHFLQFPQGTLQKHYEKLLKSDDRLSLLSKKPYPISDVPFFGLENMKIQNSNSNQFFEFEEQSPNQLNRLLELGTSNDILHSFTLTRTPSVLQQLSKLELPIAFSETTSPNSVIDLPSVEKVGRDCDEQQMTRIQFWPTTSSGMDLNTASISFFPTAFGYSPASVTDLCATDNYPYIGERTTDDIAEQSQDSVGVFDLEQWKLNSAMNCNGDPNYESLFQISEIQTDWNVMFPVSSYDSIGNQSETNGYLACGISYPGEISKAQSDMISGKNADFLASISSPAPFPVLFVNSKEVGEIVKWT